jgi:23S rRNA pseudouridine2604 synthase
VRLNKFLSESGVCSRREADTFIETGRVTINGAPAALGTQVSDGDDVRLDGDRVGVARKKVRPVYIALNKPVGITCTTERHVAGNIVDFVGHPERIFPIGRLDKDSEGLILLTNDGDIVNEVLRAEHNHEKEYVVGVDHSITPEFVASMTSGVRLSDATTRPCKVTTLGPRVFRIILTQGLNRQIRRMSEALGYHVEALRRVRIMHITLGNLAIGRWRNLSPHEVSGLFSRKDGSPARSAPSAPTPKGSSQDPAPRRGAAPRPPRPGKRSGQRPGSRQPSPRGRR